MRMIVGLGNPGTRYTLTRHNIGFMAVDALARGLGAEIRKEEMKAHTLKAKIDDVEVLFVKPITFMNLSGESVIPLMQYYKIEPDQLLVLHDELDLPFAQMRFQRNRGPGGHNGLKSINEHLGHQDYARLKLGVGRSSNPNISAADHVLQNFSNDEQQHLSDFLNHAGDGIESFLFDGLEKAANRFNQKAEGET